MKNSLVVILLIFSFSSTTYSQNYNSSELVFFKDRKLTQLLESIIIAENICPKEKKIINWYIDFKENNILLVSQGRIANLLEMVKGQKRKILSTVINDEIVFVLAKNDESVFSESGFFIDLNKYKDYESVFFEDFSAWQIIKNDNLYKVANEKIWKCK